MNISMTESTPEHQHFYVFELKEWLSYPDPELKLNLRLVLFQLCCSVDGEKVDGDLYSRFLVRSYQLRLPFVNILYTGMSYSPCRLF